MNTLVRLISTAVVASLIAGGCAGSKLMRKVDSLPQATSGQARIVFMRHSFAAGSLELDIHEIRDGRPHFIGSLPNRKKFAYITEPGEKIFMTTGNASDFMLANVEAGKTYYVINRPNWGTRGFAPTPVRQNSSDYNMQSEDFQDWVNSSTIEPRPEKIKDWLLGNRSRYILNYQKYWPRFQQKSSAQKLARTLNPEDGVVVP